ncbi:hypothetical protein BV25DRAFT_1922609 [Artomyces pyxidatus]|uniref:Uncharacterized protein n=1 Tax=Artomyces pyxidatus TaxID=48021 RepID=A0ACB8SFI4_9AGAM|nr:hypothetical protein BV25DRAFT_1922609 [Artomyces pyxidatus]
MAKAFYASGKTAVLVSEDLWEPVIIEDRYKGTAPPIGHGINSNTLDVSSCSCTRISRSPAREIYSFNESNSMYFRPPTFDCLNSIKCLTSGRTTYFARYVESMDVHQALLNHAF